MTGPATVIALAEMHRLAEETSPKVRQELVRLGCQDEITIHLEDVNFRLKYHGRSLVIQPQILHHILKQIDSHQSSEHVWESITGESQERKDSTMKKLALLMLILMSAGFTIFFLSQS